MMKKLCFLITLLIIVFTVSAQENYKVKRENNDRPYFFIQVADPQFGMFEENNGFEKETGLYGKAVMRINRLRPDFIVITGDFVHRTKDSLQIAEFKRITAKIDSEIPVYYTPGNHDIGHNPESQDIKAYIRDFGYDRFSFKHKGSQFIGFNSSLIKANTPYLEQQQYNWLRKKLSKNKRVRHTILFCHYPFFIKAFDEPENYSNISLENREKYLALFEASKVDAIFSGHLHNNAIASFGEIQLVTTSAVGKPLGDAPSGLRIVKVFTDSIEHIYYGLDEIPDSIRFE